METQRFVQFDGHSIPNQGFSYKKVLGDLIMCKFIDVDENGDIKRKNSNIFLPSNTASAQSMWRLVEVLKVGSGVKEVEAGETLLIANSDGVRGIDGNGDRLVFISEKIHAFVVVEEE